MVQCDEVDESIISSGCFWLFDNDIINNNEGICTEKDDEKLKCENIKKRSQCNDKSLEGISNIEDKCFWIESDGINIGSCKEKV
jgi:SUMO ligase MMS21 Smc5/6 complex component